MEQFETIEKLINSLRKLPGVGIKSAERMAYQILDMKKETREEMILAFKSIDDISLCPICSSYMEKGVCPFCNDDKRDEDTIVVVSYFKDALAFEKLKSYHGLYHILNGSINPSKGVGVNDINIPSLIKRIEKGGIKEVILATNPTLEGETTALYVSKLLENYPVTISRLAYGLPMGGQLDYADELTLTKALEGRSIIRKD
ncbi:MAG: recombination mediator RecR [Bacilli bacterium]|nr:recombination mediator RecR [Bacillales bacterium]MDY2575549.1 recombination mediator RecR [Bacilli bacterium]